MRDRKVPYQVGGVFDVDVVTELEAADLSWRDISAKIHLLSNQLLQTPAGKPVLRTDIHRSCQTGERQTGYCETGERQAGYCETGERQTGSFCDVH